MCLAAGPSQEGFCGEAPTSHPSTPSCPPVPNAPPQKVDAEAPNTRTNHVLWSSHVPGPHQGEIRAYQVHYVGMEGTEAQGPAVHQARDAGRSPSGRGSIRREGAVGGARCGRGHGWAGSAFLCPASALPSLCAHCPPLSQLPSFPMGVDDTVKYVSSAPPRGPGPVPWAVLWCDFRSLLAKNLRPVPLLVHPERTGTRRSAWETGPSLLGQAAP